MTNSSFQENLSHMKSAHNLIIPLEKYLTDYEKCFKLIAQKIFTYKACLGCDYQNFSTLISLQNHMIDTNHFYINDEDLEEHLSSFYDIKKLSQIDDIGIKLTKQYKILKLKLNIKSNNEEEEEDLEPFELPNGELLTNDGKVLGNKIYKIYYKQKVRLNKFEGMIQSEDFKKKN